MGRAMALTGQHVGVVGASRGIGLEFVRQLLNKNNTVLATARKPHECPALKELQQHSKGLSVTALDTSSAESIQEWAQGLDKQKPFDLLLNIAGVIDGTKASIDSIDAQQMLHCFQTNSIGPLLVTQQLLANGLLKSGSIVANMTSKMGSIADNGSGGKYAYRASKTALNQITKSMSIDLQSQGITCVLLHPGWVRTDMTEGKGLIDAHQCVSGLISVLESKSEEELNGGFFDYKNEEIPW